MSTTTTATCQPGAHVFTPLYPGWEPDDQTPCDCLSQSWAEARKERLRAWTEAGVAKEAGKRREPRPPGPNPDVCNVVNPATGEVCGGRMSPPHRRDGSEYWMRTCKVCVESTGTKERPAFIYSHPVIVMHAGELPFTSTERLARRPLDDVHAEAYRDVKHHQAGERDA